MSELAYWVPLRVHGYPLTAWAVFWCRHFVVGLWMLSHGAMSLQESIERFILSPGWGGKGTRFVRDQSDLRIV